MTIIVRLFQARLFRAGVLAGCCLFATSALAQKSPAGVSGSNDSFTLNLKDADITTLIATVSEVTGRNFVVDPRVKGNVTVLSNQSMTPAELYQTFLSVLDVHGYAAVPSGEVIKIIPQISAKQDGGFGGNGTHTDEDIVTKVIHVTNVPADQLVPILRPLVPQYGHLAAYAASNTLIISDREANVARLTKIVHRIDANGNKKTTIIHLQHASAKDVSEAIDKLQGNSKNVDYTVVPDERTNSVIISGNANDRARLRGVIADMDTKSDNSGGTQVFYLNYADAEELAPVLQAYATGQSYSSGSSRGSRRSISNNSSGFGNSNGFNSSGGSSGSSFGSSSNINRNSATSTAGISGKASKDGISVIAESAANALIVTAPATKMAGIKKVIKKLDIRRGQVLVEAIIAEVSLSRSRKLGVNLASLRNNGPTAASILDPNTLSSIKQLAANGTPLGLIQQGLNIGLGSISSGGTKFALLLNALSGDTDTNILSTPSLITRDNEEAEIKVGKQVPFVTGSYTNGGSLGGNGVNPFNTVQRKDVGLVLSFTPQISAGDTIQLSINQEISSIAAQTQQQSSVDLITNNRSINTAVEIQNGQILVLGGLIDDNVQVTRQAVPVLSRIPLLGALFRYNSTSKSKRNLLNFIRPTILRGDGEANYYSAQKYRYIRHLQQGQSKESIPLMGNRSRPQLPPMDKFEGGINSSEKFDNPDNDQQSGQGALPPSNGGKRRGDQFGPNQ
ncbi:MAG: type II secretion system secretin GspD [Salinisphaera sp.]|nr:type II secretion system secretin GspD [Salinisphaera sp.]